MSCGEYAWLPIQSATLYSAGADLAREYSASDLVDEISLVLQKSSRSMSDVVICYASAVALGMKSTQDLRRAIETLPTKRLPWLEELLEQSTTAPVTVITTVDKVLPKPQLARSLPDQPATTGFIIYQAKAPKAEIQRPARQEDVSSDFREVTL